MSFNKERREQMSNYGMPNLRKIYTRQYIEAINGSYSLYIEEISEKLTNILISNDTVRVYHTYRELIGNMRFIFKPKTAIKFIYEVSLLFNKIVDHVEIINTYDAESIYDLLLSFLETLELSDSIHILQILKQFGLLLQKYLYQSIPLSFQNILVPINGRIHYPIIYKDFYFNVTQIPSNEKTKLLCGVCEHTAKLAEGKLRKLLLSPDFLFQNKITSTRLTEIGTWPKIEIINTELSDLYHQRINYRYEYHNHFTPNGQDANRKYSDHTQSGIIYNILLMERNKDIYVQKCNILNSTFLGVDFIMRIGYTLNDLKKLIYYL